MLQYFKVLSSFFLPIEERKVLDKIWYPLFYKIYRVYGVYGLYGVYRWIMVDYGEKWSISMKSGRFGRFRSILMKTPGGTHGFDENDPP